MRYEKTRWGYIKKKKAAMLAAAAGLAAAIAAVYLAGYYLNGKSNANLFTIGAMLLVLPAAKLLVSFFVFFPYRTPAKKDYEEAQKALKENLEVWSDLVITSQEKVMNLDFLVVSHHFVVGALGKKGQDLNYIQNYLSKGVHNFAEGFQVKVYENQKAFLKAVRSIKEEADNGEQKEKAERYLKSLIA